MKYKKDNKLPNTKNVRRKTNPAGVTTIIEPKKNAGAGGGGGAAPGAGAGTNTNSNQSTTGGGGAGAGPAPRTASARPPATPPNYLTCPRAASSRSRASTG